MTMRKTQPHRSTTLRLLLENCPRAIDFYDAHAPIDRDAFQYGIAAHAVLQTLIEHPDDDVTARAEAVVRELVTNGRSFYGHAEPPMDVHAATTGRDVALAWLERDLDGLDPAWKAEVMLSVDRDWQPCEYEDAWLHAVIDVVGPCEYADEDMVATGQLVRDWKGSFATEAADLDSLQQKIQALLVAAHNPDAAFIRRQVTSLQTFQTFSEDLWLDEDGQATLDDWRRDIAHVCAQADVVGDDGRRPARPGPRCGGCRYVLRCEAATDAIFFDGPDSYVERDPVALAANYAILDAMRTEMAKTLRPATKQAPIQVDGGEVGYTTREIRKASTGSPVELIKAWVGPDDWAAWEREHADVLGLLAALKPGSSSIDAVGKILFQSRGPNRDPDWREKRDALKAATLTTTTGAVFGVTKSKD